MMDDQKLQLRQLALFIWLLFLLVGAGVYYWGVWRANDLAVRDDNPRVVEAALRVQRGTIYGVHDQILAQTIGPAERVVRHYPLPNIGPAVGYYSFRHGAAGIEAGLNELLSGADEGEMERLWREALHRPQVGRDVRLTLDSRWQLQADAMLQGHRGAIVILSVPDGAVRVMASQPGFDPNQLDELFDMLATDEAAPLLNRATQGLYQPGLVLQPLLYAAGVEQGRLDMAADVNHMSDPVELSDQILECEGDPAGASSWSQSLVARCPAPLLTLAQIWSQEELMAILVAFGLLEPPDLPMATESADLVGIEQMERAVLGQGALTVSPLQIAMAFGSLANEGRLLRPQILSSVRDEKGDWQLVIEQFQPGLTAVAGPAAQTVLNELPRHEGIIEHHVSALAGPGGSENDWYLALAPAGAPQLIIVIVIEDSQGSAPAQTIGRALLRQFLFVNEGS